jgi:hypothetical protein
MFVMYGGFPGYDVLWANASEPERARRKRTNLKLVASNDLVKEPRAAAPSAHVDEAVA